ncbi:MAG: hydrogenase maturation protease [Actinomycetia bacterium]|nr:hydrogenase maturation protease [Actinomycetes bacterium]
MDKPMDKRIVILCVGNLLLCDEGLGPQVAAELTASYEFPANVEVLDRGVMGMAVLADIKAADDLLIIDAVDRSGQPPGTVLRFQPEDLASYQTFKGAHDVRLADVLAAAALVGISPQCECLGVQVVEINPAEYRIGLTPAVQAALPLLLSEIELYLSARGVIWTRKSGESTVNPNQFNSLTFR